MTPTEPARLREFAALRKAELLRRSLVELTERLYPVGIQLMVFKGVHLAFAYASHPGYRPFDDADVWSVNTTYDATLAAVAQLPGVTIRSSGRSAARIDCDGCEAPIDLHRYPLHPWFGRFSPEHLRAACRAAPAPLGRHIVVPPPEHAALFALCSVVRDGFAARTVERALVDVRVLLDRDVVEPERLSTVLRAHGLLRAGLAAMWRLRADEPRLDAWLLAIAATSNESRTVRWVRQAAERVQSPESLRLALGRLLVDDPVRAALGASYAVAAHARAAFLRRRPRA